MFYAGVRFGKADRREKRLRKEGVHGRAAVRSCKESEMAVDGVTSFELVLDVEIPGHEPYVVKLSDLVPHPWAVTTGADLPVFVDRTNPQEVVIDWFTLQTD